MFARFIALFLVALALGGCVSITETRTEKPDGSVKIEKSINGWVPSAPVYVAPSPRYGYDHYNRGYYQQGVAPVMIPTPNGRGGTMFVPTCFPGVRNSPPGPDGLCHDFDRRR